MPETTYYDGITIDNVDYVIKDVNASREEHSHSTFGTSAGFAPASGNSTLFLKGDGTWDTPPSNATKPSFKKTKNLNITCKTNVKSMPSQPSEWKPKTWNGLTNFNAEEIWSDENNIYYSNDTEQYKLNKETNTWEEMTWDIDFYGSLIWTDGENLYYSSSSKQKIFMSLDNNNNNLFDKEHRGQLINNIFIHGLALDKDDNLIYRGHDNNFYKIEGKVLGGYLNEEYRS